jgi:hypothetical protein
MLIHRKREGSQHAQGPFDAGAHTLARAQSTQRSVAEACHQQRKVVILVALHNAGADPAMLAGDHIGFVEKDCLPDPA